MFESEINFGSQLTIIIITVFIVVIIGAAFLNVYLTNQEKIKQSAAEICGLKEKIRSTITKELIFSIPEYTEEQKKAKLIMSKVLWQQDITFDEYQTVLDVLEPIEKQRLGLKDLEKICYLFKF